MGNNSKVTSFDVAERAGVSRTTVSLVLNKGETPNIPDETRQRVFQAARDLNYVPNVTAQRLARGRSGTIALAIRRPTVRRFSDPYLANTLSGITDVTRTFSYRLALEMIGDDANAGELHDWLRSGAVDGIITEDWASADDLAAAGFSPDDPIVIISDRPVARFRHVHVDLLYGQRAIVSSFLDRGHRRIGCIPYAQIDTSASLARRWADLHKQLDEAGIALDPKHVAAGDRSAESGYEAMLRILRNKPYPTVVFGMNDAMALGAMRAITERGLKIPQDMSVVGFDGHELAALSSPALQTVRAPWLEMGRAAATMLMARVQDPGAHYDDHRLLPELAVGASLGDPAV